MEMMNRFNKHILIAAAALSVVTVNARERIGAVVSNSAGHKVMAGCSPAQSAAELTVNNVRTIIYSGSDMWWDLFGNGNAWYAVPKVENKADFISSCFAGNVWFGGLDVGGQLKIAAQTYRQQGIDFWSGPLSTLDASVTQDVCSKYDKIFKMTRKEVDDYYLAGGELSQAIANWPGNGDLSLNQDQFLAPFVDNNNDNIYTPSAGDYPAYDLNNDAGKDNLGVCKARLFGDETLWWVYNDNGGVHQATGGKSIGMEVRAQAFAFKTTDDINNMTFYNYQIINRSSFALVNTYMTVWTDADLGQYADDYIGCDVKRGLGYIYNGDQNDENAFGVTGYGAYIPALGCDFFQGPINTVDLVDNDGDGLIDEPGEQMGMTKFLYFNNNLPGFPTQTTDPQTAAQYYQYMTGYWRDGTPFTCGGNAYGGGTATSYVYPGDTYSTGPGSCGIPNWEDQGVPGDRRFMQSSGPFTLQPGAVNYVTFGLPWARTTAANSPKSSLPLLKIADDKAQALFDNCFKVLSGPEAPDMTIQEMSNELILYFTNKPSSNNYLNNYKELDVSIIVDTLGTPAQGTVAAVPPHFDNVDKYYHFEGFKVYQLKNATITQEELRDQSKAKLVFSCDVANGVQRLINYEFDAASGGDVAIDKTEGQAAFDKGLQSTFHFTQDQFSLASDKKVINNKTYYFYCVAYAYNEFAKYKEDVAWTSTLTPSSEGQKKPYLEGRKSKKAYGIPHSPDPEKEGSISNSAYGYGPKVTRHEGQGNGGNAIDLSQGSIDQIVSNGGRVDDITYDNGRGPIAIKVVDPLNVPNSNFSFKFINRNWFYKSGLTAGAINDTIDSDPCRESDWHKTFPYQPLKVSNTQFSKINPDSATWVLTDLSNNKEYYPCKSIRVGEEFYFSELGLSLNVGQSRDIADINLPADGDKDRIVQPGSYLESSIGFADATKPWLTGLPDIDGATPLNWIRSGSFRNKVITTESDHSIINGNGADDPPFIDPTGDFKNVLGGTWAPYVLTASTKNGVIMAAPGFSTTVSSTGLVAANSYDMRGVASVDIVFTKDKSKWTHCLVLEECDENISNPTGAKKLEPRRSKSVDKQGIPLGTVGCNALEASVDSIPATGTPGTFQYGLGWFPGYAINIETGERLNIAFGEDSYQGPGNIIANNNGADMMWNPTSSAVNNTGYPYAFGGRHYIYVFGHNRSTMTYTNVSGANASMNGKPVGVGTYSQFADMAYSYKLAYANGTNNLLNNIWTEAMWVNIPLVTESRYHFTNPADMPCDAKVRIRVKKAYKYGLSGAYTNTATAFRQGTLVSPVIDIPINGASTNYTKLTGDVVAAPVNNNFGYYTFSTGDIFTETNNSDKLKSVLDIINVVPNPYYAYSAYEGAPGTVGRIDNRVRITNLPNNCKIKIFTLNGTLIRTFDRDVSGQEDETQIDSEFKHSRRLPYQDWDLKNQSGITVSSGLYIIYVNVPGVGEKILKWFGVMRPLDLQNY